MIENICKIVRHAQESISTTIYIKYIHPLPERSGLLFFYTPTRTVLGFVFIPVAVFKITCTLRATCIYGTLFP